MQEIRVPIPEGSDGWQSVELAGTEAASGSRRHPAAGVWLAHPAGRPAKRLLFCQRCRGMVAGRNAKYLKHRLVCLGELAGALRNAGYTVAASVLLFVLPATTVFLLYDPSASNAAEAPAPVDSQAPSVQVEPGFEDEFFEVEFTSEQPPAGASTSGEREGEFASPIRRVVIDAGHGGADAGSVGPSGLTEKDLVLDIANRLRIRIESGLGARVVLTRDNDVFVPLEDRTEIANRADADLFISIHANASQRKASRGFETYFVDVPRPRGAMRVAASRQFATHVQSALATTLPFGKDRGVKSAPFAVLVGTEMPSILAEVSFISNPEDEILLKGEPYREQIAEALFEGVRSYSRTLGGTRTASTSD